MVEKINCAYDELVDIDKLIPNPKNNNKHPKNQIERLAKIIDFQGQRAPVVVSNLSGFIVKGHGRLEAIKLLGWEKCAVDYQDYESEAQETGKEQKAICSIGDKQVNINGELIDFAKIVEVAREYVKKLGGFEKLAEWGLR